jgi:glycosyltransferase involved in cell wall biosynthesis
LQVLHIISNKDKSGGTLAAMDLHNALLKQGYKSSILSTDRLEGHLHGRGYRRYGGMIGHLQNILIKVENILAKPGLINFLDNFLLDSYLKNFRGVVHIHVTHVAQTSFILLNHLAKSNKVIWTLHDLWPLTAKCIHPTYCKKWLSGCNNCPKLNEYPVLKWDNTPNLQQKKQAFISAHKIFFIAPSKWIKAEAQELVRNLDSSITVIKHGLDTSVFRQQKIEDIILTRAKIKIQDDEIVVFFPQARWDDAKKGKDWYSELLEKMEKANLLQKFCFIKIYGDEIEVKVRTNYFREITLPYVMDKLTMASYYNTADVTVSISEIETFGLCIAESLACKTPVIARYANGVDELLDFSIEITAETSDELVELIISKNWEKFDYHKLYSQNFSFENWANKHIELYELPI